MMSSAAVDRMMQWRRVLHAMPETGLDTPRTAALVAEVLLGLGLEVCQGVGGHGVVGVLRSARPSRPPIGLRADMDALAIQEENRFDYRSAIDGAMHACGHDGHTAMLLGAAHDLAGAGDLDRDVVLIFQAGEEHGLGARAMIRDGLFDRFAVDEIHALHNLPGLALGTIAVRGGPVMAAEDNFRITLRGTGGHAARPHVCDDLLGAGCQVVTGLQRIASTRLDPMAVAVVSVTELISDGARNILPSVCVIKGDTRAFTAEIQTQIEREIRSLASGVAAGHGLAHEVVYTHEFAPTVNAHEPARRAQAAAHRLPGLTVMEDLDPLTISDDFGLMLQHKPGAYAFLGITDAERGGTPLHNASYDFNDRALPFGAGYFVSLVRSDAPLGA